MDASCSGQIRASSGRFASKLPCQGFWHPAATMTRGKCNRENKFAYRTRETREATHENCSLSLLVQHTVPKAWGVATNTSLELRVTGYPVYTLFIPCLYPVCRYTTSEECSPQGSGAEDSAGAELMALGSYRGDGGLIKAPTSPTRPPRIRSRMTLP